MSVEKRKKLTRSKIIKSARDMCAEGRYFSSTVEELIDAAGVSRAGFYNNFSSKDELLKHLVEDHLDWYDRQFKIINSETVRTEDGIRQWIDGFVRHFREVGEIMAYFRYASPMGEMLTKYQMTRLREIEVLGLRLPQLGLIEEDGSLNPQVLAELFLWIFQLEQLCMNLAHAPQTMPGDDALRSLTRQFIVLLKQPLASGPDPKLVD